MATKLLVLLLAAAVMVASWSAVSAQSCTAALIGLAPCLSYIQGTASTPSSSCCTQLAGIVQSQPQCLCLVLNNGGAPFGIAINQTRALALPGACNVQTPSPSLCNSGGGGPAAAPAPGPSSPPTSGAPPTATPAPSTPSPPSPLSTPSVSSPPSPLSTPSAPSPPVSPSKAEGGPNRAALPVLFALIFSVFMAAAGPL